MKTKAIPIALAAALLALTPIANAQTSVYPILGHDNSHWTDLFGDGSFDLEGSPGTLIVPKIVGYNQDQFFLDQEGGYFVFTGSIELDGAITLAYQDIDTNIGFSLQTLHLAPDGAAIFFRANDGVTTIEEMVALTLYDDPAPDFLTMDYDIRYTLQDNEWILSGTVLLNGTPSAIALNTGSLNWDTPLPYIMSSTSLGGGTHVTIHEGTFGIVLPDPVPEPSSALLVGLAGTLALLRRRRLG